MYALIAADFISSPAGLLYQYGAIGVALVCTGYAVRILFKRETEAHERERERADRLEEEVRRLNTTIQDKIVPVLSEATRTLSEALYEMRRRGINE